MIKVWISGCFDILHRGHIELFKYAAELGDHLTVGADTDDRVNRSKGEGRPFNSLSDRVFILRSIKYIDDVVHFSSDEELTTLIKNYSPDIILAGSDWKGKNIVGEQHSKSVIFFDRVGDYSTTSTLKCKE